MKKKYWQEDVPMKRIEVKETSIPIENIKVNVIQRCPFDWIYCNGSCFEPENMIIYDDIMFEDQSPYIKAAIPAEIIYDKQWKNDLYNGLSLVGLLSERININYNRIEERKKLTQLKKQEKKKEKEFHRIEKFREPEPIKVQTSASNLRYISIDNLDSIDAEYLQQIEYDALLELSEDAYEESTVETPSLPKETVTPHTDNKIKFVSNNAPQPRFRIEGQKRTQKPSRDIQFVPTGNPRNTKPEIPLIPSDYDEEHALRMALLLSSIEDQPAVEEIPQIPDEYVDDFPITVQDFESVDFDWNSYILTQEESLNNNKNNNNKNNNKSQPPKTYKDNFPALPSDNIEYFGSNITYPTKSIQPKQNNRPKKNSQKPQKQILNIQPKYKEDFPSLPTKTTQPNNIQKWNQKKIQKRRLSISSHSNITKSNDKIK